MNAVQFSALAAEAAVMIEDTIDTQDGGFFTREDIKRVGANICLMCLERVGVPLQQGERHADSIEKMRRYIERTNLEPNDKFYLALSELSALFQQGKDVENGLFDALGLAFDYGKAKGYRLAIQQSHSVPAPGTR